MHWILCAVSLAASLIGIPVISAGRRFRPYVAVGLILLQVTIINIAVLLETA